MASKRLVLGRSTLHFGFPQWSIRVRKWECSAPTSDHQTINPLLAITLQVLKSGLHSAFNFVTGQKRKLLQL